MANTFEFVVSDLAIMAIQEKGNEIERMLASDLVLAKQKLAGMSPRQQEVKLGQYAIRLEERLHKLGDHVEGCRFCVLAALLGDKGELNEQNADGLL
ncbi:MAG TPA: hypothetical protein VGP89_18095 [Candidatus Angelobacter sp.]|jgi:hypothetical protein|nr:hypothetical protein [Candidatus Angelobacter sp.]